MMRPQNSSLEVFLYPDPVDMRKAIDGLALIVEELMALDPFSSQLFVFCNRQRDKIKMLYWERNGFCLFYKRLEKERFKWPKQMTGQSMAISVESLNWLLDGIDIEQIKRHKSFEFSSVM